MVRTCHPIAAAWRRVLSAVVLAGCAILAGCGGGGGGDSSSATPASPSTSSTVTGTAASGAPLAGLTVTLKDSANRSATATTSASGAFTLDSSGLTPPFLLQVTTSGGTRLLSVSTDASRTATLNITPLTDLVVRSWYSVQGRSADTAFSNPSTLPAPSPQQVRTIADLLLNVLQLAINAAGAPVSDSLDLIAKPFVANGTGIDRLLDNTHVTLRSGGADLALSAGTATQSTALSFVTATSSISASTTTANGTATSTASVSAVVPVQPAQATAFDAITADINSFVSTVNSRKTALTRADLEPFFAADLLHEGLNRTQFLDDVVQQFRQFDSLSASAERILSLDAAAGRAEVLFRFSATMGGATETDRNVFVFLRGTDGAWRFAGDQRIASVSVQAEGRRNQGLFTGSNGPSVNVDVRPPLGLVSAVTATSSFSIPAMQRGATEVRNGISLDVFFTNTGPIAGTLPAAGTPVTLQLQKTAGGSVSYVLPLNAFTTELIQVTAPTGTAIAAGTATVRWTLPTTYAVARIQLSSMMFTADPATNTGFQCINDVPATSPTATSGTVTIDPTCNGQPVRFVNINVSTDGVNGERSLVTYSLTKSP